jgi:hypothetical protein
MQLLESQVDQLLSRNEALEAQLQHRTAQGLKNEAEILTLRRLVADLSAVSGLLHPCELPLKLVQQNTMLLQLQVQGLQPDQPPLSVPPAARVNSLSILVCCLSCQLTTLTHLMQAEQAAATDGPAEQEEVCCGGFFDCSMLESS